MDHILNEGWGLGAKTILESYTTDVLVSSLKPEKQCEMIDKWISKSTTTPDLQKQFEAGLLQKWLALPALAAVLKGEPKPALVENLCKHVYDLEYYHFKYSSCFDDMKKLKEAFETKGKPHKNAFNTYNKNTEAFEKKMEDHEYFKNVMEHSNI